MSRNQGESDHTSITMSDDIEQSDFLKKRSEQLESAMDEIQNWRVDRQSSQTKPLIQRVPRELYSLKEDFERCFEPREVAFGPLHHGKLQYDRAEKLKLKFAARFAYMNKSTYNTLFKKVMAEIKDLRKFYDLDDIKEYDDENLAWMLFIDGCALLYAVEYDMSAGYIQLTIGRDLTVFPHIDFFLLENQIPYRVLRILIASAYNLELWEESITKFIAHNAITYIPDDQSTSRHPGREDYAHLLERYREAHLAGIDETKESGAIGWALLHFVDSRRHRKAFRSITELKASEIQVKPTKTGNLKNIFFSCNFKGELMMPPFLVDGTTASKFLNLAALEMCRDFKKKSKVITYLCFLQSLIHTADDVKELRATGMLHNYLGSNEEVVDLFSKMSRDLLPDHVAYSHVVKDIHRYCNNPLINLIKAYCTYFRMPWSTIAPSGAIIGLVLSATQTYLSSQQNKQRSD